MAKLPIWWAPDRQAQAVALRQGGTSWDSIATAIDAPSGKAVQGRMRREGLLGGIVAKKTYRSVAPALPPGWPKQKTCLKCRRKFKSEGPHNHLCGHCRNEVLTYGGDIETLYGGL